MCIIDTHAHSLYKIGYVGFYPNVEAVWAAYPEGGFPGQFFINGETQSVWMWNISCKNWCDTNHPFQAPVSGIIGDPATFKPDVKIDVPAYYLYISGGSGVYEFPYFVPANPALHVETKGPAIILLWWNGQMWQSYVTELRLNPYISQTHWMYKFASVGTHITIPIIDTLSVNPGKNWHDVPPALPSGGILWMTCAMFNGNGTFHDPDTGWSKPVKLTGLPGEQGEPGKITRLIGEWDPFKKYVYSSKYADLVRFHGFYYKLLDVPGGAVVGVEPNGNNNAWEYVDNVSIYAEKVYMKSHNDELFPGDLYYDVDFTVKIYPWSEE